MTVARILEELYARGYCLVRRSSESELVIWLHRLGQIVQVTDVTVRDGSRAFVTSARPLDLHTDHHKADVVAWHCHAQCERGGETLLVDARVAFGTLDVGDQGALEGVLLYEHRVFPDDPISHPLVERVSGGPRFYYSYWLVRELLNATQTVALEHFRAAIHVTPLVKHRLAPGESLLVLNRRVLHGRTAIEGQSARFLRRFWVSLNTDSINQVWRTS